MTSQLRENSSARFTPRSTGVPYGRANMTLITSLAAAAPHYRELGEVCDALASGYARLKEQGIPPELVTVAMLNATVNVFSLFEKRAELPSMLRELADTIEREPQG